MALNTAQKAIRATVTEKNGLAADRARVADIDTHILELDTQILCLRREQNVLHQEKIVRQDRLDAYVYPVLTLPPEIVSEIFVHFLPVYPIRPPITGLLSPTVLTHICRTWRGIALSTPALWRAVLAHLPRARWGKTTLDERLRADAKQLRLLIAWLKRSGSCLLSIELQSALKPELVPYMQAIGAHCARWEHLKVLIPTLDHLLNFTPGPLSSLRSLTLGLWDESEFVKNPNVKNFAAPLLHRVALQRYYPVYDPVVPWSQLTVLIIDMLVLHQCPIILNRVLNLVECRLTIDDKDAPIGMAMVPIVPLLHLQTLVLRATFSWISVRGLLNLLTLPALRKLQITEEFLRPGPIATLDSLVSRSRCKPQKIRIIEADLPLERYKKAMPSVEITHRPRSGIGDLFFVEVGDVAGAERLAWDDSEPSDAESYGGQEYSGGGLAYLDSEDSEDGSEVSEEAEYHRDGYSDW
ncbi:hypothetical protein C8R47DRAFT_169893 [Mycena vitilis]|nr:hypothetical protein C8R47DRAFT_169893 [Mycena vitilis]